MANTSLYIVVGEINPASIMNAYTLTVKDAGGTSVATSVVSKPEDLRKHVKKNTERFATFCTNSNNAFGNWVLDGSIGLLSEDLENYHTGIITETSDDVTFEFAFAADQTSDGVVVYLEALHLPIYLEVTAYDSSDAVIETVYNPVDAFEGANKIPFSLTYTNIRKIVIIFGLSLGRIAHLVDVDLCLVSYFDDESIKTATTTQSVSPVSVEIPSSALDFTIYSTDTNLSILNPQDSYSVLRDRRPVYLYSLISNTEYLVGKFYVENWATPSEYLYDVSCIDIIGYLGSIPFLGFGLYAGMTLDNFLDNVLTPIGVEYDLDVSLASITLTGVASAGTVRDALLNACFAAGAFATCAGSDKIRIEPMVLAEDIVTLDFDFDDTVISGRSISLAPLVTGVEVTSYKYEDPTNPTVYTRDFDSSGNYIVQFDKPVKETGYTITGATVTDFQATYCAITVTSPGTVTFSVLEKKVTTEINGIYTTGLPDNTQENVVIVDKCTLVSPAILSIVAIRIYNYYLARYVQTQTVFGEYILPGQSASVSTIQSSTLNGIIENISTDLITGIKSKLTIRGVIV